MGIIFNYNKISLVLFFLFIYSFTNATEKLENLRLIIIGDSLIQGYGLPKDKGFVNQLQKKFYDILHHNSQKLYTFTSIS